MGGPEELVDRADPLEAIAAVGEDPGVPGKARGVAGHIEHLRHLRLGERLRLRHGAGPRRIEHHRIEPRELGREQRPAKQVARLAGDAGAALPGCREQRIDLGRDAIRRVDRVVLGERKRERAATGEEVRDGARSLRAIQHELPGACARPPSSAGETHPAAARP